MQLTMDVTNKRRNNSDINRTYMQRHQSERVHRLWYGADATDPANITAYDRYQTYDLDTLGNRLIVSNDGAGQSYGSQSGDQSTNSMNRYEIVDAAALAYDARGNTLDDGLNTYAYDGLNRRTLVTNTAAITPEYVHDVRGGYFVRAPCHHPRRGTHLSWLSSFSRVSWSKCHRAPVRRLSPPPHPANHSKVKE